MLKIGDNIDGWTLTDFCGEGSFGKVFLAEKEQERKAIKIFSKFGNQGSRALKAAGEYRKFQKKYLGESVMQIYGQGETEDYLYYTMEAADPVPRRKKYCPDTLQYRLDHGRTPSIKELTLILLQLLGNLQELHKYDRVHRDIKPANILFIKGRAKLGDIDLFAETGSQTISAGTRDFLPGPEFKIADKSVQNDIFSLVKTIYCCLPGCSLSLYPQIPYGPAEDNEAALRKFVLRGCCLAPQKFKSVNECLAFLEEILDISDFIKPEPGLKPEHRTKPKRGKSETEAWASDDMLFCRRESSAAGFKSQETYPSGIISGLFSIIPCMLSKHIVPPESDLLMLVKYLGTAEKTGGSRFRLPKNYR